MAFSLNSVRLTGHLAEYRAQGRSIHIDHLRAAAAGPESPGIDSATGQARLFHDGDAGDGHTLRVVTTPDRKVATTAWYMPTSEAESYRASKQDAVTQRESAERERRTAVIESATKARANKSSQKARQWQRDHNMHSTPNPRCPLCS